MKIFARMLEDQTGASAAEYALILSMVSSAIILAGFAISDAVAASMIDAGSCIETTGQKC